MSKRRRASRHQMQLEVPRCPLQRCRRRQEWGDTDSAGNKRKTRGLPAQSQAAARQRDANRVPDLDLIVQRHRPAASGTLALDRNAVARVLCGVVAKRIGPDHAAGQMQIDMRARPERRQFPMVGIDQRKQFYVRAAILDCLDDRLDRRDRCRLHRKFRTASPTRTVPPFNILQFSPDRLISGSKIGFPVISSMCRQGIDSRVASSSVAPSQN